MPREILIIDQSDNDATESLCRSVLSKGRCPIVYSHENFKSLVRARNIGLSKASGDIISFLDDDLTLDPHYFEDILKAFEDPSVGGVTGNPVPDEGKMGLKWKIKSILMRVFAISSFDGGLTVSGFGFPIYERQVRKITDVQLFAGYSMNFRREVLEGMKFDEWFTGYCFREDVDFSYQVSKKARLVAIPTAKFTHHNSPVARTQLGVLRKMQFRNYYHVFLKHKNTHPLAKLLFFYSLSGIIFIDFIEWITNRTDEKRISFFEDFKALKAFGES